MNSHCEEKDTGEKTESQGEVGHGLILTKTQRDRGTHKQNYDVTLLVESCTMQTCG